MFTLILRNIPLPPSQGGDGTNHPPQRPPLGDVEDRPLVEEREEFFALSREEEKAV